MIEESFGGLSQMTRVSPSTRILEELFIRPPSPSKEDANPEPGRQRFLSHQDDALTRGCANRNCYRSAYQGEPSGASDRQHLASRQPSDCGAHARRALRI